MNENNLTVRELYEWAVKNKMLDAKIEYHESDCGGSLPASIINILNSNTIELECS